MRAYDQRTPPGGSDKSAQEGRYIMEAAESATAIEIAHLEHRLASRFDRVDPRVVHEIVSSTAAHFATSPIQTFVPLLTEKAAVAELKARAAVSA